jgi:magnesium transporter
LENFDFHELDIEACLEENQNPRIDHYNDYVFITLHFPKYNKNTKRYYFNEMNFFLSKNRIISLRKHDEHLINKIFEEYKNKKDLNSIDSDEDFKITSAYILYEILQVLIEKMFKSLDTFSINLRMFEDKVFKNPSDSLVKEIMIKKRNIVSLKHMIKPAINVLKMMELRLKKIFDDDLEVYFEDLEDKIQKAF